MFKKTAFALLCTGFISLPTTPLYAAASPHFIVAPHCLIAKMTASHQIISANTQYSLIETNDKGVDELADKKHSREARCGGFVDITSDWQQYHELDKGKKAKHFLHEYSGEKKEITKIAYGINYPQQVAKVLAQLNMQRAWNNLTTFSGFNDRYSRSSNGLKAAEWIKSQVTQIANGRTDVKVYMVPTVGYIQPSVVAKFGTSNDAGVVIGGHMDTTSGLKPGADDDGTGSMTVLEVANVLINSGMQFKKPIYFIWYAAEEVGLVGSKNVVNDFKAKKIPVAQVLQLDMTGYPDKANPNALWLMDDNIDPTLNTYLESLINTYIKQPVKHDKCGYACSDHATWTRAGYPAVIPFEASMTTYNPYIHTSRDTMEKLVLAHMTDYAKLALAFAVELAQPTT